MRPQKHVATSELQDELESLQRKIEAEKEKFGKKEREEQKLQRQQIEICNGIIEREAKIEKLQGEIAKRNAVTAFFVLRRA